MAAAASMPAAAVACLLLSALAVVSAAAAGGVTFPAPAPAPQVAVDAPHQEAVTENPCGDILCVQANGGNPQGGAHVASLACPGEGGGHGVVCCCCPLGFGGSGRCCPPRYCRKAPSPPAVSA